MSNEVVVRLQEHRKLNTTRLSVHSVLPVSNHQATRCISLPKSHSDETQPARQNLRVIGFADLREVLHGTRWPSSRNHQ